MLLNFRRLDGFESNDAVLSDELEAIWNSAVVGFLKLQTAEWPWQMLLCIVVGQSDTILWYTI
jgi:hypothetical protein